MQKFLNLILCLYICLAIISCVSDKDSSLDAFPDTENSSEEKKLSRKEIIELIESTITDAETEAAEKGLVQAEEADAKEKEAAQKEKTESALNFPLPEVKNTQQIADFIEKNYEKRFEIPFEAYSGQLEMPDRDLLPFGAIVLEAYRLAYPDKKMKIYEKEGDWCIELDGMIFAWAEGRLLPFSKRVEAESYGKQIIYPNNGKPRNPKAYTQEDIAELMKKGTKAALAAEKPVDNTFTQFLLQTNDRIVTERNIRSVNFLGHRVNVHKMIVPFMEKIDGEIRAAAKTSKEVSKFVADVSEIGGYNWRTIDGTAGRRSYHSYGLAIDINAKSNKKPTYWEWVRTWNSKWMLVPQSSLWLPPEPVIKIFEKYGFVWGGTWDEYDTMHFEYRPELAVLAYLYMADEE
ncbi:MAG: M15 family metallopeptidase [Spirochaetaceae bacterium]|nr:M15 family metallopeptidase [Spirochaetaceae bacterium]